jgi:hypothetical protein
MTQLKPVSDLARRLLAKMGETPQEHQNQILSISNKTHTKSHATTKIPNVHDLNRKVEQKITSTEPIAEVTRRLENAKTFEDEWVPEVYVLFIRKSRCTSCGHSSSCMDLPSIFLRHRRKNISHKADQTLGLPRIYHPVRAIVHPNLPKVKEVRFATTLYCENCFDVGGLKCPQANCPQENTALPMQSTKPTSDLPSTSPQGSQVLTSATLQAESAGSYSLPIPPGFAFESYENEGHAHAIA